MNFSIVLASRERTHLLESLLESIYNNTYDKNNCEVICVLDNDDRVTKRFIPKLNNKCPIVKFVFRDRAGNLNDDYINWGYKNFSTGNNIIVVNDDVVFKTKDWDRIALEHLNKYFIDKPDGIGYGWIEDGLPGRAGNLDYCCFPLVTRKAAEVAGFVMPVEFPGWGADIGLYRIYAAIGRIVKIEGVKFAHISHHTGLRNRDHISFSVERKSHGTINPIDAFNINPYVERISKFLTCSPCT